MDTCEFCGVGVPHGKQCSCPGAKTARKNHGRPDNIPETTVASTTDEQTVNFDEE